MRFWGVPCALVACYAVVYLATMHNYGLTWDEAYLRAFWGERNLQFFLHVDRSYLDYGQVKACDFAPGGLDLRKSPMRSAWYMVLPASTTLAAACAHVLSTVMSVVDGRHCLNLLLLGAYVFLLFGFCRRIGRPRAALFASVCMLCHPRFWAHAHQNVKDVPEALFICGSLICGISLYETLRARWAVLFAVLWGLALGTKANALTVPFLLALGLIPLCRSQAAGLRRKLPRFLPLVLAALVGGALIAFLAWPRIWPAPLESLRHHFRFLRIHAANNANSGWNMRPLALAAATMPPLSIAFLLVGVLLAGCGLKGWRKAHFRVFLLCALMPVRTALPGSVHYDGIRLFMEFLPASCFLAGLGADAALVLIGRKLGRERRERCRPWLPAVFVIMLGLPGAVQIARHHPFEIAYCNCLAGGTRGADRSHPDWCVTDYWCASYRIGCRWLKANVKGEAYVWTPVAWPIVAQTAHAELPGNLIVLQPRDVDDDGAIAELLRSGPDRDVYVMAVHRPNLALSTYEECLSRGRKVMSWGTDGVEMLTIRVIPARKIGPGPPG